MKMFIGIVAVLALIYVMPEAAIVIGIMGLAAAGFYAQNVPILLVCTFLMGLHSTIFGPVKFAYLPQVLGERELTGGNGMVEMGTFVAILRVSPVPMLRGLGTSYVNLLRNTPLTVLMVMSTLGLSIILGLRFTTDFAMNAFLTEASSAHAAVAANSTAARACARGRCVIEKLLFGAGPVGQVR